MEGRIRHKLTIQKDEIFEEHTGSGLEIFFGRGAKVDPNFAEFITHWDSFMQHKEDIKSDLDTMIEQFRIETFSMISKYRELMKNEKVLVSYLSDHGITLHRLLDNFIYLFRSFGVIQIDVIKEAELFFGDKHIFDIVQRMMLSDPVKHNILIIVAICKKNKIDINFCSYFSLLYGSHLVQEWGTTPKHEKIKKLLDNKRYDDIIDTYVLYNQKYFSFISVI